MDGHPFLTCAVVAAKRLLQTLRCLPYGVRIAEQDMIGENKDEQHNQYYNLLLGCFH